MLTKKKYLSLLDALVPELTDENEEILTSIKNDFDERDAVLRDVGTVVDDEEIETFDYVRNETPAENNEALETLQASYDELTNSLEELKKKYRDRFFYGTDEEKEEIEEEPEEKTIEDLLKKED